MKTPALAILEKQKIPYTLHEYSVKKEGGGYGNAVAREIGASEEQVFKTLIITDSPAHRQLAVAVIPVAFQLDLKACARVLGWKKSQMSDPAKAQTATGYITGGISPLGQKTRLPVLLDESAATFSEIYCSAGKRGLQIELAPEHLQSLTGATMAAVCHS